MFRVYINEDKETLIELIKNSQQEDKGEKYIEVYICRFAVNSAEPDNFRLGDAIKVFPEKVALFYYEHPQSIRGGWFFYRKFSKKYEGVLLNFEKKIKFYEMEEPYIFLDRNECFDYFEKAKELALKQIDRRVKNLLKLRDMIMEA